MARSNAIQTDFSSGELSPFLHGRVDTERYGTGLKTCENFIINAHGGAQRRAGSRFVSEGKTSANATRLIRFEFNRAQSYILELGNLYMRFYTGNGQISVATVASVAITAGGTGYSSAPTVTFSAPPNGTTATGTATISAGAVTGVSITNAGTGYVAAPTITFGGPGSSAAATATLATATAYEIATPWTSAQIGELQVAQSADVMYFVHPSVSARKLTRTLNTSWALTEPFMLGGSTTLLDGAISSTSSTSNITVDSTEKFDSTGFFKVDDEIIAYTGKTATTFTGISRAQLSTTGATHVDNAIVKAPRWDSTTGFPRAITFHQQRLWVGGTTEKPQTVFASKTDVFEDFTTGVLDADGLEYQIASYRVNQVQWMSSTEVLIVGTAGGEFKVQGGTSGLTPSNVQVTRQTSYGGKNIQPRHIGYQTLFIDGTGTKLRSYEYQFNQDIYESEDLTFLAEHLTQAGIKETAYPSVPDPILWVVLNDGVLLGMTYDKQRKIVAWHKHATDGTFESIATIPKDNQDQVWVISKRTIGGATKRFVEFLDPDINVDSGLTYSGGAVTSISGLTHLEGKTVSILGDNAVYPDATVSSGSITLGSAVTSANIGLKYTSTLVTLPVEDGNPAGTAQGRRKRWNEIYVRLHNSFFPKINSILPPVRHPSTVMGTPEPKTTGDVKIQNIGYDLEGLVTVTQDLPGPTHVLSIFGTLSVNTG